MTDDMQDPDAIAPDVSEEAAPVAAPQVAPDDVEEARLFGWKAPEEWVGDKPAGYIDDPKRYLDRIKDSRIFKTLNEQRERERRQMEDHLRRLDHVSGEAVKMLRAEYDAKVAQLNAQQRQAVETADVAQYERLQRQKDSLRPPQFDAAPVAPQASPVVAEYEAKNEWVKDPVLRMEGAQAIDLAMRSGTRFADEAAQLQYAEGVMRRKYPHMFQPAQAAQTAPTGPARVDSGGLAAGGAFGKASAFAKLPPEAQAQFRKDAERGLFSNDEKGRARYAELYNEG
jgi:hypothetical protein